MVDFPKTLFNASELMTISSGFRNAVSGITEETIQRLIALIAADQADLNSAMSKGPTSKYSTTIAETEDICDTTFCTFRNLAKTLSEQNGDTAVADAARMVTTILRNVGWDLHKLGYKKQLVQLAVLDEKLSTPEARQALETAGLTRWYRDLGTATANLRTVAGLRVDEINENDLPLTKEAQVKLYGHLLKLYNHIDIQEEVNPTVYTPNGLSIYLPIFIII